MQGFFYRPKLTKMFGNNKKPIADSSSPNQSYNASGINSLVSGTGIEGNIKAHSDIRIDGELNGNLECSGRVIIGTDGRINGEVKCQNAIVEGYIQGTLIVSDELDIRETGSVHGEVNTGKLKIAPGGIFNVNCNMSGQKIKSITPTELEA